MDFPNYIKLFQSNVGVQFLLLVFQYCRICGAVIFPGKDLPVLFEHLGLQVENVVGPLLTQVLADMENHAQIPFGATVREIPHVNPEVALSVSNDVADMKVSVQTGSGVRKGIQAPARPFPAGLPANPANARFVPVPVLS